MFEHSVKVPRQYKIAASIFKKVSTEGGSIKTLLYDNKLRHFRTNVLFALITETIKHAADIEKIFECTNILESESRLDPWLAKVLTAELLYGKKSLPGKSKPEQTVLSYHEKFEKFATNQDLKTEGVRRPRYVRINTNLLTTSDAIREFQDEGYKFIRCTSGSYDDYLEQIKNLTEYDFIQDYHVKTVFVFPASTKLHENQLYMEFKIILQDKATTLAVHLLAPPSGSKVLDMCAAPGMKTTQVAAFMRNEGTVYAVERNPKRFETLCEFVENTGSKCVVPINRDVLDIKRGEYEDVEYILLDPSCSGSGMELSVHKYMEESRLAKLTSLQEKFLKHAMNAFPNAKKIVYSTCSIHPEENERVVTNVVKTSRSKWRVLDAKELLKGQWNNIGSGMYGSMGNRCIYARLESDMTTGFFVAVLERDQKELSRLNKSQEANLEKPKEIEGKNNKKKSQLDNKNKKVVSSDEIEQNECSDANTNTHNDNEEESIENNSELHKKKKRKKKSKNEYEVKLTLEVDNINESSNLEDHNNYSKQDKSQGTDGEIIKEKRSKKYKMKNKSYEYDNELTNNYEIINRTTVKNNERSVEFNVKINKKNKKKKRNKADKNDDEEQKQEVNETSIKLNKKDKNSVITYDEESQSLKKKKKHKMDLQNEANISKENSNVYFESNVDYELLKNEHNENNKKRKHKDKSEVLEDNEIDEPITKKKKKKKLQLL